jgi:peptidoglycan/LPS O-acetylase OafA/YrhL
MAIIGFLMYGIFFWMDQAGIRKLDYFGAELYLLYFSAGMLLRYWVGILSNEKLLQWFGIAFVGLILLIYTPYASRFISAKGFQVILLTSAVISFIYARQAALCQFISERSLGERLGRISYGLYAYSGLILTLFRFLFGGDLGVVPILLSLLALILVAGCSYRYFEKPVYLYVKSKIDRRS